MNETTDAFGRSVKPGDKVLYTSQVGHSKGFVVGEVVNILPAKRWGGPSLNILPLRTTGAAYGISDANRTRRVYASSCVRQDNVEDMM